MQFYKTSLENCSTATGIVIVIDVLRAFSTAAYAFASGVQDIILVSSIEDAFALKNKLPNSMLMGEEGGLPIDGFDFGNSPPQFDGLDLNGYHLIQRTSSGTQGAVRSKKASTLLGASFCNVGATIRYVERLSAEKVTFVITGWRPGGWGDEDAACADYLEQMLSGNTADPGPYLERVRDSVPGRMFTDSSMIDFPVIDLEYCLAIDKFNFVMPIHHQGDHLLMIAHTL